MSLEPLDSEANATPLTKDHVAEGMHKSFANAEQLLRDARQLRDTSPGRSLALAILALEELGKVILLAEEFPRLAAFGTISWPKIRRRLTSHRAKQVALASYGKKLLSLERPFYKDDLPSGVAPLLDRMKQWGFYVDWTSQGFLRPSSFGHDNSEWTDWLLEIGEERLESLRPFHGEIDGSHAFVNRGVEFIKRMASFTRGRNPSTEDELAEALRDFLRSEFVDGYSDLAGPRDD